MTEISRYPRAGDHKGLPYWILAPYFTGVKTWQEWFEERQGASGYRPRIKYEVKTFAGMTVELAYSWHAQV